MRGTILLVVAALVCLAAGAESSQPWSFGAQDQWAGTCGLGVRQSPIDINFLDGSVVHDKSLSPLQFSGFDSIAPGNLIVTNNGKNIAVAVSKDSKLAVKTDANTTYTVAQLNFHWGFNNLYGSEHSINGKYFPLELHLVGHKGKDLSADVRSKESNAIAQFAIFFSLGKHNPSVQALLDAAKGLLPSKRAALPFSINLGSLLPPNAAEEYLTYVGSLTAPPCTENAQWFIARNVLSISPLQLEQFRQFINADGQPMSNTFRGVQRLNGRKVSASFSYLTHRIPSSAATALALAASTPALSTPFGVSHPVVAPISASGWEAAPAPYAAKSITDVEADYAIHRQLSHIPYGTVMSATGPTVFPAVRPEAVLNAIRGAGPAPCAECVVVRHADPAFPVRAVPAKSLIEADAEAEADEDADADADAEETEDSESDAELSQDELAAVFAEASAQVDAEEAAESEASASFLETGAEAEGLNMTKPAPPTGELSVKPNYAPQPAKIIDNLKPTAPESPRAAKLIKARIEAARENRYSTNDLDFSDPYAVKPETDERYANSPLGFAKLYDERYGPETPAQVPDEHLYARKASPYARNAPVEHFSRAGTQEPTYPDQVPSNAPIMPHHEPYAAWSVRARRHYYGPGSVAQAANGAPYPYHPFSYGHYNFYHPDLLPTQSLPRQPRFPMGDRSRRLLTATQPNLRVPYAAPRGPLTVAADHSSVLPSHMTPTKHYRPLSPRDAHGIDWVHALPPKDSFTSTSLLATATDIDGALPGSPAAQAAEDLSRQHAAMMEAELRFEETMQRNNANSLSEVAASVDANAQAQAASHAQMQFSPDNVKAAYTQFEHYLNDFEPRIGMLAQYKTRRMSSQEQLYGSPVGASALNMHAAMLEAVREAKLGRQLKEILGKFKELKALHARVVEMRNRYASNPAIRLQLDVTRNNLKARMDALLESTEQMKELSGAEVDLRVARLARTRVEEDTQRKALVGADVEKIAKDISAVQIARAAEAHKLAKLQLLRSQLRGTARRMRPDSMAGLGGVPARAVLVAAKPAAAATPIAAPAANKTTPVNQTGTLANALKGASLIEADELNELSNYAEAEAESDATAGVELPSAEETQAPAAKAEAEAEVAPAAEAAKPLDVPVTLNSLLDDLHAKASSLAEAGASATEASSISEALDNLEELQAVQAKVERVQEEKIARLRLAKNRQAVAVEQAKLADVKRKHTAALDKERAAVGRLQTLAQEAAAQKKALGALNTQQDTLRANLHSLIEAQQRVEATLEASTAKASQNAAAEEQFTAMQERARAEIASERAELAAQRAAVEKERNALESRATVLLDKAQRVHVLANQLKHSHEVRIKKAHRRANVDAGAFVDVDASAEVEVEADAEADATISAEAEAVAALKAEAETETEVQAEAGVDAATQAEIEAEYDIEAEADEATGINDADIEALAHAADF